MIPTIPHSKSWLDRLLFEWVPFIIDRRVVNGHYLPKDRSSLGTAMFFDIRKLFSHISMMAIKKTKWSSLSLLARSAVNKAVIAVNKYSLDSTLTVGCCAITACLMPNIYHVWRATVKKRHHASWIETWLDGGRVQWYLIRFLPAIDGSLFGLPKNSNQGFFALFSLRNWWMKMLLLGPSSQRKKQNSFAMKSA